MSSMTRKRMFGLSYSSLQDVSAIKMGRTQMNAIRLFFIINNTDYGDRTVIGGLALKFYQKVAEHYDSHIFYWRGPEPHVGEKIMSDWLEESKVEILFNKRVRSSSQRGRFHRKYFSYRRH